MVKSRSLLLALVGFFVLLGLRVFPVYLNHFKVLSHLKEITKTPEAHTLSKEEILATLEKRFAIDNVDYIDVKKDVEVKIDKKAKKVTIMVPYEVRVNFIENIYIVVDFAETQIEVAEK
ncbi:MAG: hypothetical protein FD130_1225 [Halothiobacillaceae bacterium]|nr:MAG: hypothetical protein FD130_1225 [Halothiobacillaceae bacterium]